MIKLTFIIVLMGLSSGLPLALTGGTLQAWMRSSNVDLSTIGLFAFVGLPYTLKFLWSPLMDRFALFGGRRKSWMLVAQGLLVLSTLWLSVQDPSQSIFVVALIAVLISFFSATQDIAIDAWRRESLSDETLGWGSSVHVAAYLFGMRMVAGAFALILSDHLSWAQVYQIMAVFLSLGILATFLAQEPETQLGTPKSLKEAVVEPFLDYFSRPGAILILLFILAYKLGDNMASHMSLPFYLDIGFTRTEVGAITKVVGWVSLAIGGLVGGALLLRVSLLKALFGFGVLQALSTGAFVLLAQIGKSNELLTFVIAFENLTAGMGTAAFVAFMASLTNRKFTATQYALLTSFMGVPRTFLAAPTGFMAEGMGWSGFFLFCTLIAIPGLMMIPWIRRQTVN